MFATTFTESVVEEAALAWLESLGYAVKHGLDIAQNEVASPRASYDSEGSTCRRLSEQHQDALR